MPEDSRPILICFDDSAPSRQAIAETARLFPGSRVVYPKFHALRIGPYWFNCAPGDFTPCRPGAGADAP